MAKKRNVENIRQKNIEDNQKFLEQLLLATARNDFLKSARSIHRNNESSQIKKKNSSTKFFKVQHSTRYNEKLKSGEISPHVPEWQRLREEKKQEAERRLLEKKRRQEELLRQRELKKSEQELKQEELLRQRELKKIEQELKQEEILFRQELKKVEEQLKLEEREKIRHAKRKIPKWKLFYMNSINGNPYQRIYKPRNTNVSQRIEQTLSF